MKLGLKTHLFEPIFFFIKDTTQGLFELYHPWKLRLKNTAQVPLIVRSEQGDELEGSESNFKSNYLTLTITPSVDWSETHNFNDWRKGCELLNNQGQGNFKILLLQNSYRNVTSKTVYFLAGVNTIWQKQKIHFLFLMNLLIS